MRINFSRLFSFLHTELNFRTKPNFSELGDVLYYIELDYSGNRPFNRSFQTNVWAPDLETAVKRAKIKWDLAEKERGFRNMFYPAPVYIDEMRINNYDSRILGRRSEEGFVWG